MIALYDIDMPMTGLPADPNGNDAWFSFDSAPPLGTNKLPGLGVVAVEDVRAAQSDPANQTFDEMTRHVEAIWHECLNTTDL